MVHIPNRRNRKLAKKNNFLSYVLDRFYDKILNRLKDYICKNKEDLILDNFSDATDIDEGEIDIALNELGVHIEETNDCEFSFDIVLSPEVGVGVYHSKSRSLEFESIFIGKTIVSCSASLKNGFSNFYIDDVFDYTLSHYTKELNGDLVPIIKKQEYDKYATEFLNTYYPQALNGEIVNPYKVAKSMGLEIKRRNLSKDKSIFGEIFFEDTVTKFYDDFTDSYYEEKVDADTIIIDELAMCFYSFGTIGITIIHECLHYYLHKKAFLFSKIYNNNLTGIICSTSGIINASGDDHSKWMEIQANGIAPCVLMPAKDFLKLYKEEERLAQLLVGSRIENYGPLMIENLANKYNVTIYSVKKRLLDLGYESVHGIKEWVDDHYVEPYLFAKGSLNSDETFTISVDDFVGSQATGLINFLFLGNFKFVENHLVINSPKYINGEKLSDYARVHLNECAIKFKIKATNTKSSHISSSLTFCYLCRDLKEDLTFDIVSVRQPDSIEDMEKASAESTLRINEILSKLVLANDFSSLLKALMEIYKCSNNKNRFAELCHLSRRTIDRYLTEKKATYDKRTVVLICVSLNLPPKISQVVLSKSCGMIPDVGEGKLLNNVLMYMYDMPIEAINNYLKKNKVETLIRIKE